MSCRGPVVEHLRALGTDVVFHVQAKAGHNTDWWPEEREAFDRTMVFGAELEIEVGK